MEFSTIKQHLKVSLVSLGLVFSISSYLQAAVVSFTPATPISVPLAELIGDYGYGSVHGGIYDPSGTITGTLQPLNLDVNSDGIDDLTFSNEYYSYSSYREGVEGDGNFWTSSEFSNSEQITASSTGKIFGDIGLMSGDSIGPDSSAWVDQPLLFDYTYSDELCVGYDGIPGVVDECWYDSSGGATSGVFFGPGFGINNGFLGYSFLIDGLEHFGWVEITIFGRSLSLNSWGWETDPGEVITAGAIPVAPVPLPPAVWLFGSGLLALFGL